MRLILHIGLSAIDDFLLPVVDDRFGSFFLVQWTLILAITKRPFSANYGRLAPTKNAPQGAPWILL